MKRILFVDDEPSILDGLRRMLRPHRNEWDLRFAALDERWSEIEAEFVPEPSGSAASLAALGVLMLLRRRRGCSSSLRQAVDF